MACEQAFVKKIDTEHLFVLQCQRSEHLFERGEAMSVALELEYEAFYPRLQLVPGAARKRAGVSRVQRRRLLFVAAAAVLFVLLMLPLRALGAGSTIPNSGPVVGQVYVVHSGDTLHSIAARVDGSDGAGVAGLTQRLAREAGSTVVVPGEHLLIP
jgi:hypothetical protein